MLYILWIVCLLTSSSVCAAKEIPLVVRSKNHEKHQGQYEERITQGNQEPVVTLAGFNSANRGQCEVSRVLKLYKEIPLLKEQTGGFRRGNDGRERGKGGWSPGGLGGTPANGWKTETTFKSASWEGRRGGEVFQETPPSLWGGQ